MKPFLFGKVVAALTTGALAAVLAAGCTGPDIAQPEVAEPERVGEAVGALTTPPPSGGTNWSVTWQDGDPQIAAGVSRVMITQYDKVYFYSKFGTRLTTAANGMSLPTTTRDIFRGLWDTTVSSHVINDDLNLPTGTACDRDHPFDTFTSTGAPNYCLRNLGYDSRVIYDTYRDRFIIVSSAMNPAAQCGHDEYPNPRLDARRSKLLVAVSGSSDPTDGSGWYVYWFDAVPGESCTTSACKTAWGYTDGDAADYPMPGINEKYLTISIGNASRNVSMGCSGSWSDKQTTLHVWNADAMASGIFDSSKCGTAACSWVYFGDDVKDDLGNRVMGTMLSGVSYGSSPFSSGWAMSARGKDVVNFFRFPMNGTTKPTLVRTKVTMPSTAVYDDVPSAQTNFDRYTQPTGPANPARMHTDGAGSLVVQNGKLFLADRGAKIWPGKTFADTAIRLAELQTSGSSGLSVLRNTIFGAANTGYGSPGLGVTINDDMVVTYRRHSSTIFSEARFAVWYSNESSLRSGTQLAAGQSSIASSATGTCTKDSDCNSSDIICVSGQCVDWAGRFDNVGVGLDAFQTSVYMMQPFTVTGGSWGYAVNYLKP